MAARKEYRESAENKNKKTNSSKPRSVSLFLDDNLTNHPYFYYKKSCEFQFDVQSKLPLLTV